MHPLRSARRHSNGIAATALVIGLFACTLQASAQVADKTRDLTPQEKESAIAFTGENPAKIMAVKGVVATFSQSDTQRIGAQVVWKEYVFSDDLCLAPVESLSAYRKVGGKSISWKIEKSYSHHLPPGLSYYVWEGSSGKDCKNLPETGLVSLGAPIPTSALEKLIKTGTRSRIWRCHYSVRKKRGLQMIVTKSVFQACGWVG
ncbi:MAG: hypothetical protein ACRES7_06590 [Gammaproteobacteria bacterium]